MRCEHDRKKTRCRECKGGSFCSHDVIRGTCSLCSPDKVFERYQKQAKERQLSFTLTFGDFQKLVSAACVYCGAYGVGVDRKDSRLGYHLSNSQPCCARCNRWKSIDTEGTFLGHVRKIAQHQEKKRLKAQPQATNHTAVELASPQVAA
jgi:hypothetical protein